uniref:Transmembrane protein n=1 Tax=Oryza sativa subsp. japonica TaxID=39947 RepID=Q6Z0C7_ORYSJ|nr:hypothetical protein [Oryza sativa Japonica Group]BAD11628.1 hypothetical protein [Oryza sativa Japonica Group]
MLGAVSYSFVRHDPLLASSILFCFSSALSLLLDSFRRAIVLFISGLIGSLPFQFMIVRLPVVVAVLSLQRRPHTLLLQPSERETESERKRSRPWSGQHRRVSQLAYSFPSIAVSHHSPLHCQGTKAESSISPSSPSSPSSATGKDALPFVVELRLPSYPPCSLFISSYRRFYLLTLPSLVQRIIGNAIVPTGAAERARSAAATTSSLSRLLWSESGRAVAPTSSPRGPLQMPSGIPKIRASRREIELFFSNSGRRAPSLIPLSPGPFCILISH